MKLQKIITAAAGIFALLATGSALRAQTTTVLTNLPGNSTYSGGSAIILSSAVWGAIGLTTSGSAVNFSSLTGYFATNSGSLTLEGGIYSDSSGAPGILQAAFTSQTVSLNTPTSFTLQTTSTYMLQANTTYWFVLADTPGGIMWLADTSDGNLGTVPTTAAGYADKGYQESTNGGGTWSSITPGNETVQVNVSPVPEPGVVTTLLYGSFVLSLARFKTKRNT